LGELGQVKAEDERVIITLSNSIFFRTGQSQLLPLASEKLDKVAEVLKDQGSGKVITIMGHTDSKGSTQLNQRLSQERAEAVRNYLMQQGVPAAQIKAVGMGEERPVANNSTAEGRANNRRVEIVVDNGQGP
jgi:outer membrane protein OmpA-like peptidoglycan-associated protein